MTDYWIIKKAMVNVPDLYREDAGADYFYDQGYNTRAIKALVPATIAIAIALVPGLAAISGFSWFFGAGLGALFYYLLANRTRTERDIDGEAISVVSAH